jgi:tetratricopeptide (TPR) repeat protein
MDPMASFVVPDTRKKITASILFVAALAVSPLVFCEPLFEPVARDGRQAEIVDRIREEQARNGAYSVGLLEPLTALSLLYQERGDHPLAIAAIERALQVQRVNYGLRTLDQAPLMLRWIKNAEAMRDFKMAWDLEQALLALAYKNPTDLRGVPILREIGDKRMDLLGRYAKGEEFLPQVLLGCFYEPVRSDGSPNEQRKCSAGSRRVAIQGILWDAQRCYRDAIRVMQRNEIFSGDELRDLEMELVRTSYLYGQNPNVGKESLRRLLAYDEASAAPVETRVESLVQLADWDLMFANGRSESDAVLETYEAAYRELAGSSQASIDEVFSPKTPVVLPAFLPNPLASEQTPGSKAYIDVAFEISKYGKGDGIEIIGSTNNVTDASKKNLVRVIARRMFRPRLTAGRVVESSPVVVRYYLND